MAGLVAPAAFIAVGLAPTLGSASAAPAGAHQVEAPSAGSACFNGKAGYGCKDDPNIGPKEKQCYKDGAIGGAAGALGGPAGAARGAIGGCAKALIG